MKTYGGQIVHIKKFAAREAQLKELENFRGIKNEKLKRHIIEKPLYRHQAEAIDAVFEGHNVVVATGTASGKSRCYLVPCMEALSSRSADTRMLFLFPLKALAQDQLRSVTKLAQDLVFKKLNVGCYDSDTPEAERVKIRKSGRIIITNPDMLHYGMLCNHTLWKTMLANLSFVVIDEAHTYRGAGREKQIRGSEGSLEPPGPLPTHLHTVYMEYSECLLVPS
jgi:DEAD/DEAH box helicase domain-containing protein